MLSLSEAQRSRLQPQQCMPSISLSHCALQCSVVSDSSYFWHTLSSKSSAITGKTVSARSRYSLRKRHAVIKSLRSDCIVDGQKP